MAQDILVTVGIPNYNGARYLEEVLVSLMKQTYKNLEILVSDNCSTDNSVAIVEKLQRQDKRIRLLKNKENKEFAENCNRLIRAAKADYVALYHADDVYEPEMVATEIAKLLKYPELAGVFTLMKIKRGEQLKQPKNLFLAELPLYDEDMVMGDLQFYLPTLLKYNNFFICPSFMARKKLWPEVGFFTEKYALNQDTEMWINILLHGYKLGIIMKPLTIYRMHSGQGSCLYETAVTIPTSFAILDQVLEKVEVTAADRLVYQKKKAKAALSVAYKCWLRGDQEFYLKNLQWSRNLYKYSFFSSCGLLQRVPFLFQVLKFFGKIKKG
ncbi:glycosyltransferase family 2 protein [bacterium]|nr:glycosyltransferase family 2 protein [bacterium]